MGSEAAGVRDQVIRLLDRKLPGWRLDYDNPEDALRDLHLGGSMEVSLPEDTQGLYTELDFESLGFDGDRDWDEEE